MARSVVIDKDEKTSRHFAIANQQSLIAYGRLTAKDDETYCLSQLIVKPQEQSKGFGEIMLRALIKYAEKAGAKE